MLDSHPTLIFFELRTGKSLSEALIFGSTNPQYDDRLLIELHVQYMKIPSSNLERTRWEQKIVSDFQINFCTQHVLPRFELGIFMYWACNSMNNLSSYCGLFDAKIRASDKDLPVHSNFFTFRLWIFSDWLTTGFSILFRSEWF